MSGTTLTIGMAHHSDFDGVYFTIQCIRMFHPETVHRLELVVVDNSPGGEAGKALEITVDRMKAFFRNAKYVPVKGNGGPAAMKDRVFREATSDAVLCVDCHVLLEPGAIAKLLEFYDSRPDCRDLICGPLLLDTGPNACWTHFDNQWRGHMLGTWGVAWECLECGVKFSVLQHGDMAEYRSLDGDGAKVITNCGCRQLPAIVWQGHEKVLEAVGLGRVVDDDLHGEPFEIPAQGCGLFSCRRDAWLGFNPHFRGFGGEEFYIHEKFRQAGHKTLCLPSLRWLHRFARPNGPKYPLKLEDRVRNYIIGHQELSQDLTACHDHFTTSGVSEDTWQAILANPIGYGQGGEHRGGCGSCKKEIEPMDLQKTFEHFRAKPSDFNEHFDAIREFVAKCQHVTEFGSRDYGVIALLAGEPKVLRSYSSQAEGPAFWKAEQLAKKMSGTRVLITHEDPNDIEDIEETDLFFYDPSKSDLYRDLERHYAKLRRFIVVHDTDIYGVKMPDGKPGLKLHLMRFMKAHPEWTVVYSTAKNYGLMVLSRNPEDKPKRPGMFQMGPTFVKHMAEYAMDGLQGVSKEQLEKRLEECWLCDLRTDKEQCSLCGCGLLAKAKIRAMRCDANKWDAIDAEFKQSGNIGGSDSERKG